MLGKSLRKSLATTTGHLSCPKNTLTKECLRISQRLHLMNLRQSKVDSTARISRDMPDRLLIEKEPSFSHSDGDHGYAGIDEAGSLDRIGNLLSTGIYAGVVGISMHNNDVGLHTTHQLDARLYT